MAWMTISSPLSKTGTTVSSRRALVSKPKRNSRSGGPFSSRGSIHSDHSAGWIASSAETPWLSALGWTFTQQVGQRSPDHLGPAHVTLGCRGVEGVELLGGQPDRYDLHRFSPPTGTPTAPTLQLLDVVSDFGLLCPLLDLFLAHHTHIV